MTRHGPDERTRRAEARAPHVREDGRMDARQTRGDGRRGRPAAWATLAVVLSVLPVAAQAAELARSMGLSRAAEAATRGLARVDKGSGRFIGYATRTDEVAEDGKGDHSPFTAALLEHIDTPGLSVPDMFGKVIESVYDATDGRQEPWQASSLRGDPIRLASAAVPIPPPKDTGTIAAGGTLPPPSGDAARAYEAAERAGTVAAYRIVVEDFPKSTYAKLAQAQIDKLKGDTPEEVEGGLGLSGEARRLVQMGLAAAGHAPGPADGVFGGLTRDALRRWQGSKRMEATGYLTREQTEGLVALGREESERRRVEAERKAKTVRTVCLREPLGPPTDSAGGLVLGEPVRTVRRARERGGVGGGLLEWELQPAGGARRLPGLQSQEPPLRLPPQGHHRQPAQRCRVSRCPDAHALSHYLFTSGGQGAEPLGRFFRQHAKPSAPRTKPTAKPSAPRAEPTAKPSRSACGPTVPKAEPTARLGRRRCGRFAKTRAPTGKRSAGFPASSSRCAPPDGDAALRAGQDAPPRRTPPPGPWPPGWGSSPGVEALTAFPPGSIPPVPDG